MPFIDPFQLDHSAGTAQGLVGLWGPGPPGGPFDYDMSGRGRDGTLTNGPTWVVRPSGYALRFDAANERVVVTTASLPVFASTVVHYARPIVQNGHLGTYGQSSAVGWANVFSDADPAYWMVNVEVSAGSYIGRRTGVAFVMGTWHWFAFTIALGASAHSDVKIYIDGVQADDADSTNSPYQPSGALWIGSRFNNYVANSEIATMRMYDRVLSAAEIAHICQPGLDLCHDIAMRSRPVPKAPAVGAVAPTSHLYGPLVGPLGGAV